MIRLALAAGVLLAGPGCATGATPSQVAGLYEINQIEMAGGLELQSMAGSATASTMAPCRK